MSHPLNLLIVCGHDPDSNWIGPTRVRKFAENLTASGSSVKVLSRVGVTSYAPAVQFTGDSVPRPQTSALRGTGARQAQSAKTMTRRARPPGIARRLWLEVRPRLTWVFRHVLAVPDREVFSVGRLFRHSRDLGEWAPEVIVASGPPFSAFFVAQGIARQRGIPWVADYRDLWTANSYYSLGPVRRRIDRVLESRVLRTASLVTTVSQPLVDEMNRMFGVRPELLLNGYDPTDLASFVPDRDLCPGLPLRIVYTGEAYGDSEPLFKALASMKIGADQVLVECHGSTVHLIQDAARRQHVEHLVSCGPRVPHAESVALQQRADILLLLMRNDPGDKGVYSGKIFEYLGARRPILMLGFSEGVAADLVRSRNAGVVANNLDDIVSAVQTWLDAKRDRGLLPALAETVSAGLTRQEQSERLRQLCETLISGADQRESA